MIERERNSERGRGTAEKTDGKIEKSVGMIKEAVERHGEHIAVGWSGGRASTTVLRMALNIDSKIKAIFENTGVEYPETVAFIKRMTKEWGVNLIEVHPTINFWEIVKKYGYPQIRTQKNRVPKCCYHLKEKPLKDALKAFDVNALVDGIQMCESHMRFMVIKYRGESYYQKTWGIWKYHPIATWTKDQLTEYIMENNIPQNEAYAKYKIERTGCWPCTGYISWENVMVKTNPKFYSLLKEKMGSRTLDHYYQSQVAPCRGGG